MKILKIAGIALGALVLLLVIALVVVGYTFDPNDYKGVAADAFTARTGRSLTVERELKLSYFPWLALETGGVTIGNDPAFGSEPFATVERVAARVKLMPLLHKQIEIGTVELDGLRLNLARDKQLRGNWQDMVDKLSGPAPAAPAAPAQPSAPAQAFALEGVRVRDGTINWRENTSELRYVVSGLNATTGSIGQGEPVAMDLSLDFRDEVNALTAKLAVKTVAQVAGDGSVKATDLATDVTVTTKGAPPRSLSAKATSIAFDRNAQTLAVQGLTTETAGVKAAWNVKGSTLVDNPTVEGTVQVSDAPLAELFDSLGLAPPQGLSKGDLGNLTLASQFHFRSQPQEVRLTNLDAKALGLQVKGEGTLTGTEELAGRVEIPEFAPNKALQGMLKTYVPPTVDVSAIDKLALSTRFDTNLTTGRASLKELKATALGATLTGELQAIPGGNKGNSYRGSLSTSRFAPDAFAKAFAQLLPEGVKAQQLGMVQVTTQFAMDAGADTLQVPKFEAEIFGLNASGEVNGRNISKTATWAGRARVAQFSPQSLMQRFGLPPQPTSDPKALTRATVDMQFNVDANSAKLQNVSLALDDTKITGDFTLDGFKDPKYRFALVVDKVDADRYLPPKAADAKKGEQTAGDLALPEHNTMNLDGTMQIGDLRLAGMQFQSVGTRVLIGNGDAKLENARAKLYGGEFNGNFFVHAAGKEPGLNLDGKATGLQLQPIIEALTGQPANFSGTGSFVLNLAGHGRTITQNLQTAGGTASFEMLKGAIKGFNVGHTICKLYNVTQQAPAPPDQPKQTEYEFMKGSATVANGIATTNDMLARTGYMDINAHGTLGLLEQKLDYGVDAKLTNKIPIQNCNTLDRHVGLEIPFTVKGTISEPTILPDFSKLVQREIREKAKDKLIDKLLKR